MIPWGCSLKTCKRIKKLKAHLPDVRGFVGTIFLSFRGHTRTGFCPKEGNGRFNNRQPRAVSFSGKKEEICDMRQYDDVGLIPILVVFCTYGALLATFFFFLYRLN